MTPCEKLGYKVGDRFVVVGEETTFPTGAAVELKRDDGTSAPEFRGIGVRAKDGDDWAFMFLENVEKIQESNMQNERVTLKPGDYVATEGMTEAQYHAVAEAFMAAEQTGEDDTQDEEKPMQTSPITTLHHALQRKREAEAEYQAALEAVREKLGSEFVLTESASGITPATQEDMADDMTDPANWRRGDIVECVDTAGHRWVTEGKKYTIEGMSSCGWIEIRDDDGDMPSMSTCRFRFHHRPS